MCQMHGYKLKDRGECDVVSCHDGTVISLIDGGATISDASGETAGAFRLDVW